jgi:GntR family transcriptional regulator
VNLPALDPSDNRPVHQRIAAALSAAIEAGTYPPGERFPGENAIIKRYGVARWTAREALAALTAAGYIRTVPKVGTFVRDDRHLIRRPRRYRRAKQVGEFATEVRAAGLSPDIEADTDVVPADPEIAVRLDVTPGDSVVRTRYRFLADHRPIQTSTSYERHDLTAGTPIELPEAGPYAGTGVITRYDAIGIRIDHVTEEVTTRAPRGTETTDLDIPKGVHVFVVRRTFTAHDRPIETADIIIPGDRYALVYTFAVTDTDADEPVTA